MCTNGGGVIDGGLQVKSWGVFWWCAIYNLANSPNTTLTVGDRKGSWEGKLVCGNVGNACSV